ncbi:PRC-barrel domain protein [alpha proteobacterium U9-1i]|nr:PRC-barrel domain protein [alpha proteobacterium U9-1i]
MPTPSGHTTAITAKRVIGSAVRDTQGNKIGHIEDLVLDKLSNNIMFAVVGFGSVLGMGQKYHPIPWSMLDYADGSDAYVVTLTEDQLKNAPADTIDQLVANDGAAFRDRAYAHYNAPRYWS